MSDGTSVQWINTVASLVTLGGVATLIALIVRITKEWKEAREAVYKLRDEQHQAELDEKDRIIRQLEEQTYAGARDTEDTFRALVNNRDNLLKILKDELDETLIEDEQKDALLERMELQFSSEQRVLEAVLNIGSENLSTRLKAARELREIRDPRTIPMLVQIMSEEARYSLTKIHIIKALQDFGEEAIPSLVEQVREHAELLESSPPSEDLQSEARVEAVLDSNAGRLIVTIGEASIPSLKELQNNEGLLKDAACALLDAIKEQQ